MKKLVFSMVLLLAVGLAVALTRDVPEDAGPFLGKWDITIPRREAGAPPRACWLEVTRDGDTIKARFLPGGGSPVPLRDFTFENGELRFQRREGPRESPYTSVYRLRVKAGRIEGTVAEDDQPVRSFSGVRPPVWPKTLPKVKPGKPVALFNGKDTSGWLGQFPGRPLKWTVQDGALVNDPPANNIYSEKKFMNFKVEVEFYVAQHSNSGVYLRGRHEIQIQDDYGKPLNEHIQGAIYGFLTPSVNACKPAGEWQTLEATLIADHVTVILNGTKIIDDAEIPALTGDALDANEASLAPSCSRATTAW